VVKEDASHYLLTFSKDMDADSAGEISHYLLSEGSVVSAALLEDRRTVRLEVETAGDFVLTVAGVRDASLSANPSEKYLYSSGGAVVGHWSLDGADETGRDESGYHEGTFRYGRAAAAEGRFNEARQLNGAGIELAETDLRLIGNTYSFWYRPAGFSGFNVLLSKGEKATGHFEIYTNEGALMLYAPDIGDLSFKVNLKTDIAQNKWHHFCFVCESKRIICYIDGEKRGTAAISCDIAALNGTLVLGSLVHDVFPATGTFDELLIIASPLDEAGVNALYTNTFLPYAKLSEAYVRLTPGEARTLTLSEQFLAACPGAQYTWSSSNEAVATVDAEGKVHAAADGEAVIYIRSTEGYDGEPFADFCVVEVGEPLPDNPESSVSAGTRSEAAAKKAGHKALIIAAAAGGAVILGCAAALVFILRKKK